MRTFIAIAFPKEVHQQLQTFCTSAKAHLQANHAPNCLRWVSVENIHLTLRFLGETTPAQTAIVATGLREAVVELPPFALTIGAMGGFPNLQQPRVLWLGVGGELPLLNALQANVEQAVRLAGFPAEDRPFSAHVTLARAQRNASRTQLRGVGRLLQEFQVAQQIHLRVNEVVHMQSELHPSGAVYRPIHHFALAQEHA